MATIDRTWRSQRVITAETSTAPEKSSNAPT